MSGREQDRDPAGRADLLDDVGAKLKAIRAAARHEHPMGDTESMLAEIEHGYSIHVEDPKGTS